MCAHAARGGPACAHAAIGNGAYGTRFEPKSPGVPAGWPVGVGLDNDVGSDSGFPGPWDDLLLLGRVDVFYFEVEAVDSDTYLVKFIHEAFTLGGARFSPASVVVPHA